MLSVRGPNCWLAAALLTALIAALGAALDVRLGWIEPAFDGLAHLFYEVPILATLRRPGQLVLVRWHLAIGSILLVAGLAWSSCLSRRGRLLLAVLGLGYALRAGIWITGGNLPLVPGDSCHYVEVATSVLRGEGPVKHYVESYFRDYPAILQGRGVLDDWATPLDAYVRAGAFRLAGLTPSSPVEQRFAAAKTVSFILNLLCLPALYLLAARRFGSRIALAATAALAVLPVHAIYAGFILRESLTALCSILFVWLLGEMTVSTRLTPALLWAVAAGAMAGLAAIARNTTLALFAACWLATLALYGRQWFAPLVVCGLAATLVITPWAWATYREYGSPFYSYTGYFEYNFSWTVHHYEQGNIRPEQFYTSANLPAIARIKLKSLLIIAVYSTMILGLPIVAGFVRRLIRPGGQGRAYDRTIAAVALVFVAATLKSIADVTQVEQLGRYYLPVYALLLPTATAGALEWLDAQGATRGLRIAAAAVWCALVWADPTWAYDTTWFAKPYQLHWPAIRETGQFIATHPQAVPPDARIMTWFPWELRVASDRTTILMPRNYQPRRIQEVIRQYGVTHVLWGSFEPPPYFALNPERWAEELDRLRIELGLTPAREIYRTTRDPLFPTRLYRLR